MKTKSADASTPHKQYICIAYTNKNKTGEFAGLY